MENDGSYVNHADLSAGQRSSIVAMKTFPKSCRIAFVILVLGPLSCPAFGATTGDTVEDIIDGCNQFIKLARKGRSRQDAVTMSRVGECLGAVRTMLATEVAAGAICPAENVKLIDAVTNFSLYIIQHPEYLQTIYVVPMRQSLRDAYSCPLG